eukprot:5329326-Amphidinium_carterae.1
MALIFKPRRDAEFPIDCYCDAPFAPTGSASRMGILVQVYGMPVLWVSSEQKVLVDSTAESEFGSSNSLVHAHRGHDAPWRSKYLHVRSLIIQHAITRQEVAASYCQSKDMIVDMRLAASRLVKLFWPIHRCRVLENSRGLDFYKCHGQRLLVALLHTSGGLQSTLPSGQMTNAWTLDRSLGALIQAKAKERRKALVGFVDPLTVGCPHNPYRQPTYSQHSSKDDFSCDGSQSGYPKQPQKKKGRRGLKKTKKQLTPTQLAAFQTLQSLPAGSTAPAQSEQTDEESESVGE